MTKSEPAAAKLNRKQEIGDRLFAASGALLTLSIVTGGFVSRELQGGVFLAGLMLLVISFVLIQRANGDGGRYFLTRLDAFHKTRKGLLVFGIVELALAYAMALRALDTGSLFYWAIAIILFVGFGQNIVRTVVHKK